MKQTHKDVKDILKAGEFEPWYRLVSPILEFSSKEYYERGRLQILYNPYRNMHIDLRQHGDCYRGDKSEEYSLSLPIKLYKSEFHNKDLPDSDDGFFLENPDIFLALINFYNGRWYRREDELRPRKVGEYDLFNLIKSEEAYKYKHFKCYPVYAGLPDYSIRGISPDDLFLLRQIAYEIDGVIDVDYRDPVIIVTRNEHDSVLPLWRSSRVNERDYIMLKEDFHGFVWKMKRGRRFGEFDKERVLNDIKGRLETFLERVNPEHHLKNKNKLKRH